MGTGAALGAKSIFEHTFFGGTIATAVLGAMEMCGPFWSFSPLIDLRRALNTRMTVSLALSRDECTCATNWSESAEPLKDSGSRKPRKGICKEKTNLGAVAERHLRQ